MKKMFFAIALVLIVAISALYVLGGQLKKDTSRQLIDARDMTLLASYAECVKKESESICKEKAKTCSGFVPKANPPNDLAYLSLEDALACQKALTTSKLSQQTCTQYVLTNYASEESVRNSNEVLFYLNAQTKGGYPDEIITALANLAQCMNTLENEGRLA